MSPMTEQQAAPGKRAAQGRATRGQLIEVATRLFAEHGYEGTSIEAVLSAAGVSRGALYHHFAGKEALFEAVVEAVDERVTAELTEAIISGCADPVDALRTAALAWIDLAGDPVIQRVMLVDAPSVLGWERWRAMDEGRTLGATRALLQAVSDSRAAAAGTRRPVLAHDPGRARRDRHGHRPRRRPAGGGGGGPHGGARSCCAVCALTGP